MILYIRHGQTEYNSNGLWMGSIDAKLNHEGRIQAAKAAIELSGIVINKIYSSPMIRAYETATIIASRQYISPTICILPGLRERCFGELEGTTKTDSNRRKIDSYQGVESEESFKFRIADSMRLIDRDESILIVSHSAVFRCLIDELKYSVTPRLNKISNCQIVRLGP